MVFIFPKEQIKQKRKRLQEKEKQEMGQIKREKEKLQEKERIERIEIKEHEKNIRERQRNIDRSIRLRKRKEQKHRKEEKN